MTQDAIIASGVADSQESNLYNYAAIERHNLHALNKTRIRFKIGLKKVSRRAAPKWTAVLDTSQHLESEATSPKESDLEKITDSEVGLKGISVFKALDESAKRLRQEIETITDWMSSDNGEWICSIELAPLVWNRMLYIRNVLAPNERTRLRDEYENGYLDYSRRIEKFFSARAWKLTPEQIEESKQEMLKCFPPLEELEEYLQVVIGRPTIIPALDQQLDRQQADCLAQITRFIQEYDVNLEQRLMQAAIAGGEQLAAELLEELVEWEPGRKPVNFRKKVEKHLKKIQVLISNASPDAGTTLSQMMEHLESILETASIDTNKLSSRGHSQLQEKMDSLRSKLLGEQQKLLQIASAEGIGLSRATAMALNLNS